jgi:ribulose-phosphate 3-epimerase
MISIIPSILTNDPEEAREMIARCEGLALPVGRQVERVSIDIIDGKFADNKTIDPVVLSDIDTALKIDYQLMVHEPINWIERCIRGQADRIIGHIEQMSDQLGFVGKVQEVGLEVGLGIDLPTSINRLDATILNDLDVVLVMSVKAGFGGQEFSKGVLNKIKKLDEIRVRDDTPFKMQVDGGITYDNIHKIHSLGADEASIGRLIFEGNLEENLKRFQESAHNLGNSR